MEVDGARDTDRVEGTGKGTGKVRGGVGGEVDGEDGVDEGMDGATGGVEGVGIKSGRTRRGSGWSGVNRNPLLFAKHVRL